MRLGLAFAANLTSIALIAIGQILATPLLIGFWGVGEFGVWVIFLNISALVSVMDFGVSGSVSTEALILIGKKQLGNAKWLINKCQIISAYLSGFVALSCFVCLLYFQNYIVNIYVYGVIYAAIVALFSSYGNLLRALGKVEVAAWSSAISIGFDVGLPVVMAYIGKGIDFAAIIVIVSRVVFVVVNMALFYIYFEKSEVRKCNSASISSDGIKKIALAAIGSMTIPISAAVMMQAPIYSANSVFGSIVVASYAATRTLSRVPGQLAIVYPKTIMPKLSRCYSTDGLGKDFRRIVNGCLALVVIFCLPMFFGLMIFGSELINMWTGGRVFVEWHVVFLVVLSTIFNIAGSIFMTFLQSINLHFRASIMSLIVSVGALIAYKFMQFDNLTEIIYVSIISEFAIFLISAFLLYYAMLRYNRMIGGV